MKGKELEETLGQTQLLGKTQNIWCGKRGLGVVTKKTSHGGIRERQEKHKKVHKTTHTTIQAARAIRGVKRPAGPRKDNVNETCIKKITFGSISLTQVFHGNIAGGG